MREPAVVALALCVLYLTAVFAVRTVCQWTRTRRTGWVPILGRPRVEGVADALFLLALTFDLAAPTLSLLGIGRPITLLDQLAVHWLGVVLFLATTTAAVLSQRVMGSAWRTGIDRSLQAPLIVHGPFGLVRNPIYTTMLAASFASFLLVATAPAALGLLACLVALEVQTRGVEEPYLLQVHGGRYQRYAARVGRFVPGLGRVKAS